MMVSCKNVDTLQEHKSQCYLFATKYIIQYCLCVLVLCAQVNMFVVLLCVCIHTGQAEKFA